MSLYDFQLSERIAEEHFNFYAFIMAAMRRAIPDNLNILKKAFPVIYKEFEKRSNEKEKKK